MRKWLLLHPLQGATVISHNTFPLFSLLGEDNPYPHVAGIGVHNESLLGVGVGQDQGFRLSGAG